MTTIALFVAANLLMGAVAYVIEQRDTRPRTGQHLRDAAQLCERQGWTPIRFQWRGPLRTTATLEMRHQDGRHFTVRAFPS